MLQQRVELDCLDAPQQDCVGLLMLPFHCFRAGLYEIHRLPRSISDKCYGGVARLVRKELFHSRGDLGKRRMLADTVKPVLRVPVIGLSPMHYPMDKRGFGGVAILYNSMRLAEVVV